MRKFLTLAAIMAICCCAAPHLAAAAQWVHYDLGPFSIDAPSDWSLTQGGIDSVAGEFTGDRMLLQYDFGLYSNTLEDLPEGVSNVEVRSIAIDGLPARQVRYTLHRSGGAILYTGIHVAEAGASQLKLTAGASSSDPEQIRDAEAVMATIRFKHKGGMRGNFLAGGLLILGGTGAALLGYFAVRRLVRAIWV